MSSPGAARIAWAVVALALCLTVAGWLVSARSGDGFLGRDLLYDLPWLVILATMAAVGALVASREPRNPIGWILVALPLFGGLVSLAEGYFERYSANGTGSRSWAETGAWLSNWAWIPLVVVPVVFLPLTFPHGRLLSPRWRVVPWSAGAGIVTVAASEAFASGPLYDHPEIVNPYGIDHVAVDVLGVGSILILLAAVAAVVSLVIRFRRADGVERQQIKWLAYAGCFAVSTFVVGAIVGATTSDGVADAVILAGVLSVPLAIGIAILRYRLYDIDLLINWTLVYGGLTLAVVSVYVALVGALSAFFHESADFWLALVATGMAALLVQPLRSMLQRRVNRLTHGAETGPFGLRGRLVEAFAPETAELQRARERLVAAREEERRRLRRDLHDGLGPALAGAALEVEAAENLLATDPDAAARLLEHARLGMQTAVADVRRLVYDLRPPALDELGLVGALREHAQRLSAGDELRVDVHASDAVDGLPAAVEVAAYRIVLEAITNTVRHAGASSCQVAIGLNGGLLVEIADDGVGLPSGYRPGVGLSSMRERAEELGGSVDVEGGIEGGTRVRALLPLRS